jgi:hypothetical protein
VNFINRTTLIDRTHFTVASAVPLLSAAFSASDLPDLPADSARHSFFSVEKHGGNNLTVKLSQRFLA